MKGSKTEKLWQHIWRKDVFLLNSSLYSLLRLWKSNGWPNCEDQLHTGEGVSLTKSWQAERCRVPSQWKYNRQLCATHDISCASVCIITLRKMTFFFKQTPRITPRTTVSSYVEGHIVVIPDSTGRQGICVYFSNDVYPFSRLLNKRWGHCTTLSDILLQSQSPFRQVANLSETTVPSPTFSNYDYDDKARTVSLQSKTENKGYVSRMNLTCVKAQAHIPATSHKKGALGFKHSKHWWISDWETQGHFVKTERNVEVIFHRDLFTVRCIFTYRKLCEAFR